MLTIADVERIAALAHLELTDDEKQLFTRQLADILAYAQELQSVDTTGVPATASVSAEHEAERDDVARESLPVGDVIRNAPDGVENGDEGGLVPPAGFFRVPRVIG